MCSIFGSFDRNLYEILLQGNADRGTFAYSQCIYGKHAVPFHISKFDKVLSPDKIPSNSKNIFYFGHCQAPTSSCRGWSEETSHPFVCNDWIVAHNGVLTNYQRLADQNNFRIRVDTNIIPLLLDKHSINAASDPVDNVEALRTVLPKLKGTYALWIINRKTNRAFIVRQGSTLFGSVSTGSFSSTECKSKGWAEIPEGVVYEIDFKKEKLIEVLKLQADSPFLFAPNE